MQSLLPTIEPGAHLAAADFLMRRWHVSVLFVTTRDSRPAGRITEADIGRAAAAGRTPECTRIRQVVDGAALTLDVRTPTADAIRLMLSSGLRCLPVVDCERLVGTVDFAALYPALASARADAAGTSAP
jgi:CBS domain-containing protein